MRRLQLCALAMCVAMTGCRARHEGTTDNERADPSSTAAQHSAPNRSTNTPDAEEAVAAAVRFVCSGQRLLDTPPTQLPEMIRSLWSASTADAAVTSTVDQLAELRDRLGAGSGPTRYRQSVMAARVDEASEASVQVSVWWVGVLTREGAVLPQAEWTTSTVTLVAEDGAWRVQAQSSESGPMPDHSSDSEPITHDDFERRLTGFVDWEANR